MKKVNLRVISLTLSASMLLSLTSCKLQKNNKYDGAKIDISGVQVNSTDEHLNEIANELVEKIKESNLDLPIDKFYDKLSKLTFIKNPKGEFKLGTYNEEENLFTYVEGDDQTIRHELLHVLLPSYNNACLDEGIDILLLHELYGYEIKEYEFEASLCKIFLRLLNKEETLKFINGDVDILKNKLSSIKPAYSDAEQFLIYANNGTYYHRLYRESVFNNDESFKEKDEFKYAKGSRKVVKDRIKIYLYNYYNNMNFDADPYDRLVEIFEILNLVNYFMLDESLGEENLREYFLEPQVNQICSIYKIDDYTLHLADEEAKKCLDFKYLDKLNEEKTISKN